MTAIAPPDLSERPHTISVECAMRASAADIYRAWTEGFDTWFAGLGLVQMRAEVGEPFVFYAEHEGRRHPHYGRFLRLEPERLIELTWLSGAFGTDGAETVVTVELEPLDNGTLLRLTHAGFYSNVAAAGHERAWRDAVLPHLDAVLA